MKYFLFLLYRIFFNTNIYLLLPVMVYFQNTLYRHFEANEVVTVRELGPQTNHELRCWFTVQLESPISKKDNASDYEQFITSDLNWKPRYHWSQKVDLHRSNAWTKIQGVSMYHIFTFNWTNYSAATKAYSIFSSSKSSNYYFYFSWYYLFIITKWKTKEMIH